MNEAVPCRAVRRQSLRRRDVDVDAVAVTVSSFFPFFVGTIKHQGVFVSGTKNANDIIVFRRQNFSEISL